MDKYFNKEFLLEHKQIIIKAVIGIIILAAAFLVYQNKADNKIDADTSKPAKAETVVVDIGGAVNDPIVATLPAGSRVADAIDSAGGLTTEADISSINRAEVLTDGEKIYIPEKGESSGTSGDSTGTSTSSSSGKVNINSASLEELQTLNGVGPATAEKIIDYREQYGRFKSAEDLMQVNGIGEKTYEKLKSYIIV